MTLLRASLLLTVAACTAGSARAQLPLAPPAAPPAAEPVSPVVMTLAELEQAALGNNPALARAAAAVRAAQGEWLQVGLPNNPSVGYSGSEIGNDGAAGQQGGYVSQQFITGGKRALARAAAGWQVNGAQQQFFATRESVLTDVRLAYFEALAAQRRVRIASQLVGLGESALESAKALFAGEEVSRSDVLQAQVELNTTRIQLQSAQNAEKAAWRRLTAVAGLPRMESADLEDILDEKPPLFVWQEALDRLISNSPQIATAAAQLSQAQAELDRELAQVVPNVTVQAGSAYDNATRDVITNVQVQLPIPLFNRNQGNIRRAQARIAAANAELRRLELGLQQRLAEVFAQYETAQAQIETFAEQILPAAEESMNLATVRYRQGEGDYLSLLTVQRTLVRTRLDYIEALKQLHQSAVRIHGYLLSGSLE